MDTAPPNDAPSPAHEGSPEGAVGSIVGPIEVSVVAPAHNEEENIPALVEQVGEALLPLGIGFEFVIVDDGSTDATREVVRSLMHDRPWLRCLSMADTPPGSGNGQSAAFHAGFRATRGRLIAVLDADLQNDPADYPAMLDLLATRDADMVQGDRSRARQDSPVRKWGSWVGRKFRLWLLGDRIRDTGCSLRVMKREVALALPLEFKGMHRFIPATAGMLGYKVVEMPVHHRPRVAGETKYGMGITKRALPGLIDCFAVRWMRARRRPVVGTEIEIDRNESAANAETPAVPVGERA
ncbi:MAG: glycosyltransferase family 2 protein [Planctomycetota bacterium]|nr:glycosyltransferase family 2 protein [Planctomycetota bacterium]